MHIAADVKHPDHMVRKEHLAMIRALPPADAQRWWLLHCPRISRAAYNAAREGRA